MSELETGREQALNDIVTLAKKYDLSIDDIGAVLIRKHLKEGESSLVSKLLGYLGAAFIFGGLALFIGMQWDMLPSLARVIVTYGSGLIAFIMAIAVLKDGRYAKASNALFLMGALLLPTGMFVFLDEYAGGDDSQLAAVIVFGVLFLQFFAVFLKLRNAASLFFGYLFFNTSVAIFLEYLDVPVDFIASVMGLSILLVSWKIDQTSYRVMASFWYFIGGFILMAGSFEILRNGPLDVLLVAIASGLMFVSIRVKNRSLLTIGTLGLLAFLGYYTDKYFSNIVGWPIALMVAGFALVGVSAWALKLAKKIKA